MPVAKSNRRVEENGDQPWSPNKCMCWLRTDKQSAKQIS